MCSAFIRTMCIAAMLVIPVSVHSQTTTLSSALTALRNHINGTTPLTGAQILQNNSIVINNDSLIASSAAMITQAFNLVSLYDSLVGPLWINISTKAGLPRTILGGYEIHYAIFAVHQALMDFAYTPQNLVLYQSILRGAYFKTSTYFPGACAPPADSTVTANVLINASQPAIWGTPVMYYEEPARRPTGCYAAPGSIVKVTVPAALRNTGFTVRVGAHSWNLESKPKLQRLDRISLVFPITGAQTLVANPVGGNIYIEVPYKAAAGIVTVNITNAVRSPFFSATSFHKTTPAQWAEVERKNPGPYTDFESDKFMMQVPTNWIYNSGDPSAMMGSWDTAMDGVSEFMGRRLVQPKTVLYMQTDVTIRGSAYFPGYPQSNTPYSPTTDMKGNCSYWMLKGGRYADNVIFHELGHAHLFTKFNGETEAAVNLLWPAYQCIKFGRNLDTALALSFGDSPQISLDQAAIMWMVTPNFRAGRQMDVTNSVTNEVRYQHRGYAKYIEIARLFGWDALKGFWYSVNQDYMRGISYITNSDPVDNRILRMSRTAGADLRPLIHFWGIHPVRNDTLKTALLREGLRPSAKIYDALAHYKAILPKNNLAFRAHAAIIYPTGLPCATCDTNYAKGWYTSWLPRYNDSMGTLGQKALQDIIDLYFPAGRPATETSPPKPDPMTFAVAPRAVSATRISMTATTGADASGPVTYQFTEWTGNAGGTSSGWVSSPVYIDSGLTTGSTYSYSVRVRDALGNIGAASERVSVVAKQPVGVVDADICTIKLTAILTQKGISIPVHGAHSVTIFDLQGRLLFAKSGTAPAQYSFAPFRNSCGTRLYVIHVVTPVQNTKHTMTLFSE